MPRQIITTANAPSSPLYSQGVKAGPHVLVSGIVGIDPGTGSLAGDTIQDQTRQALAKRASSLGTNAATAWASISSALRAKASSCLSSVAVEMDTGDCIAEGL